MKEHVAEIVAAYVRRNRIDPSALPNLIASVSKSLTGLVETEPAAPTRPAPAVSIRRSVTADTVICLDCGWKGKMLRRHLMGAHGMTPDAYRQKWGLATDHPLVSGNYAARRSELAKSTGLGRKGGRRRAGP